MLKISKEIYNKAHGDLEADILVGAYKPRERLIESEIMDRYGITRNAVRNIFRNLETKGLIRHIPNRGVLVAEMETKEAEDLYAMRVLLENYAADLIAKNIDAANLDRIVHLNGKFEKAVKRNDFNAMMITNLEFHQAIVKVSGNSILAEMVSQLRKRALIIRHYSWFHEDQIFKSVWDHAALIEALKRRDAGEFRRINESHILAAFELYTERKYERGELS